MKGKNMATPLVQPAMGYLVWTKCFPEFLSNANLGKLLAIETKLISDPKLQQQKMAVENMARELIKRGVNHIRTGISWTEWFYPGGKEWIRWYLPFLAEHFTILPNLTYTPPELGIEPRINSPPRQPEMFGQFVSEVLFEFGNHFEYLELWNEPNLITDWDGSLDPDGTKFLNMFASGAKACHAAGKKVVMGGPNTIGQWLERACTLGILEHVDVFGMHGLRGTWEEKAPPPPWKERVSTMNRLLARYTDRDIRVWMTEYGFSTTNHTATGPHPKFDDELLEEIQAAVFVDALQAVEAHDIERVYWFTLYDMHLSEESVRKVTTGWEDVLQHHFGDIRLDGKPKLLGKLLSEGGPAKVVEFVGENNLWHLAHVAIDRGDPGQSTTD
ncbi:MAG: hypothetical protein V4526_01645 [Patescibacteria group bacterium]